MMTVYYLGRMVPKARADLLDRASAVALRVMGITSPDGDPYFRDRPGLDEGQRAEVARLDAEIRRLTAEAFAVEEA